MNAGPHPDSASRAFAHAAAVRGLRSFLTRRGRGTWAAGVPSSAFRITGEILADFASSRGDPVERLGLDVLTGAPEAIVRGWNEHDRRGFPRHALHLAADLATLAFGMVGDFGDVEDHFLLAAPDERALDARFAELDDFLERRQRESSELQVVGKHRVRRERSLDWDDLILPPELKDDIRGNVEAFFRGRALYDRLRLPYKRGFLLVGPPGNGKTLLCRILAARVDVPVLYLLSSGEHEGCESIGAMFARAERLAPCLLVFEDLDSVVAAPGRQSFFLNLMDGFRANDGLLVVATTNHPELIDPAILNRPSRFDRVWKIDNPDRPRRRACLGRLFAGLVDDSLLDDAAERTDGFSFAFLKELYVTCAQQALAAGRDLAIDPAALARAIPLLRRQMEAAARSFDDDDKPVGFRARTA